MWKLLSEKKFCVGSPVVIVSVLDWLRIAGVLCTFATTQTGVGTVPEVSEVVTSPLASDVAEVGDSVIPPGTLIGNRLKSTSTPALPLLLLSTTLNFTRELFGNVAEPVVEVPMIAGVADTNCILLVAGMATVIVELTDAPVTEAVITSVPEAQLLSL